MAGLSDMEELIASVDDPDVADYLREAYVCYGTGAYRACIVLTSNALFDGLKKKIDGLSSTNKVCKKISQQIKTLHDDQKPFESDLVDQMKSESLFNELEADRLKQIMKHRNKSAHPSGHNPTAEEARFVFSESIMRFLSKPIRQTSYLLQSLVASIAQPNFFPSITVPDIKKVVEDSITGIEKPGYPALVAQISDLADSTDKKTSENAETYVLGLASLKSDDFRPLLAAKYLKPKSISHAHARQITQILSADPKLLASCEPATLLRVDNNLVHNGKASSLADPFTYLRNPLHAFAAIVIDMGEAYIDSGLPKFRDWVFAEQPLSPDFLRGIVNTNYRDMAMTYLIELAKSSQFSDANRFASAAASIDEEIGDKLTDAESFRLVSAVANGAYWGAYEAINLRDNKFQKIPKMKQKAGSYMDNSPAEAQQILDGLSLQEGVADLKASYF